MKFTAILVLAMLSTANAAFAGVKHCKCTEEHEGRRSNGIINVIGIVTPGIVTTECGMELGAEPVHVPIGGDALVSIDAAKVSHFKDCCAKSDLTSSCVSPPK